MGQVASRIQGALNRSAPVVPADDEDSSHQPTFSSNAGSYFGSHFLMCGCRFDLAKPESYLFGENSDLDLLGSRAVPFPYASPLGSSEATPLNLLINVRKESVKFVRVKDEETGQFTANQFRLEFTLDAECPCFAQIHFNAREYFQEGEIQFAYRNKRKLHSQKYHFDIGCDQNFNNYVFDVSEWDLDELHYAGGHYFPFVIMLQTEGMEKTQSQTTMCTVEPANEVGNIVLLKPLRQKIACDGVVYLLQEIFGIENKEQQLSDVGDEGGLECIICMSDVRDTVILPCRHLCICNNCADTLRYKLNTCPICRSPFRALIHIRAKRQNRNLGYETVTLVEGLNGPLNHQYSSEIDIDDAKSEASEIRTHRKTHSRQISRGVNIITEMVNECVESPDGIEMKYIPKDVKVVAHCETPVLSNVSSRSPSPDNYATPEEVEVDLENLENSPTLMNRRQVNVQSSQSSSGLLESESENADNQSETQEQN